MTNSKNITNSQSLIKAIVFDYGGVVQELLDSAMCSTIAASMHVPIDDFNIYYQNKIPLVQTGKIDEKTFVDYLAKSLSVKPPENYVDLFIAPFNDGSHLYESIVNIIEQLNIMKYSIAVLSNTIPSHADLNRKRGNYRWFGKNVFLSFEIGYVKPSPKSFKYVAAKMNIDLSNLLLIDDNMLNVEKAKMLGMNVIHHDSKTMSANSLIEKLISYSITLQLNL